MQRSRHIYLIILFVPATLLAGCAGGGSHPDESIYEATASGNSQALIKHLGEGDDPDSAGGDKGETALHVAARLGNSRAAKALAISGADLNARRADGATPLALAILEGHLSTSKALIRAGARVNTSYRNKPLLTMVVEQGSLLMAQVMLTAGARVNAQNADGDTALMVAVKRNDEDMQMLLRQSGGVIQN